MIGTYSLQILELKNKENLTILKHVVVGKKAIGDDIRAFGILSFNSLFFLTSRQHNYRL